MSLPESVRDSLLEHSPLIEEKIISTLSLSKQEKLKSAMLYLINSGGKRLRATLPYLIGDLLNNPNKSHYDVGAAIEIIHNFTLIHDDIMDNDSMRRGRPSVHVAFDVPTAINAGDAMLAVAFELISSSEFIDSKYLPDLVKIIGSMVRRVSEGQQLDIDNENRRDITIEDYLYMIEGKTAVMFEACARSGAILSGATPEEVELLGKWGLNLGLCFQIVDDLIDVISDSNTSGKPIGSDLVQGKMTCMVIHAINSSQEELVNLEAILGKGSEVSDEQILMAISDLEKMGSIEYCKSLANKYYNISKECLMKFNESNGFEVLSDLTDYHINRIN
ncbi:MAG: polyprenyl synthetase family protein [Candidatus Thermoplasmatota archaeon]|nr:polyprenyl synthetase family protein [Candidatus Thermoplasmatota archaeon]